MHSNPNARLTERGRHRRVSQHLKYSGSLSELARQRISIRCVYRWLARYRSGAAASLADRRSMRQTKRRTLDLQQLQHALDLRHQRLHLRPIGRVRTNLAPAASCTQSPPRH